MPQEKINTFVASFQNQNLQTWESENGYLWSVTNSLTTEIIAQGKALSQEKAMIDAAQAAGADWGNAKWRSPGEDEED